MDDKKQIIKAYSMLKEKVTDNYDFYYHAEILEDIGEDGEVTYLIDDQNEFLYNVGLSYDLKNVIDSYLDSKECYEYLIKLVELKKITDKRILSNPEYDENFAKEFIFDIKDNTPIKPIINFNPTVRNKEDILNNIFIFLSSNGYLGCTKEVFISHFEPSKEWSTKILWLGNLISLVGLIDDLFIRKILPPFKKRKLRNKTVLNHFKSENGDFNNGSVKTEGSNICQTSKYKEIHNFISSLKVDFD